MFPSYEHFLVTSFLHLLLKCSAEIVLNCKGLGRERRRVVAFNWFSNATYWGDELLAWFVIEQFSTSFFCLRELQLK